METKATIPIPFLGIINENNCKGIKLNHKLFTQCSKPICDESNSYCLSCFNQSKLNAEEKPHYGNVYERLEKYRKNEPYQYNGILEEKYGNVLQKLKISKEKAIKELKNYSSDFPETLFDSNIKKRGRPKKQTTTTNNTNIETNNDQNKNIEKKDIINNEPKKRGRPKKNIKIENSIDDLYDEEVIVHVKQEIYNGNLIYVDKDGNKYDQQFNKFE